MKKFLAGAFAGALLVSAPAIAAEATTTLKVSGWHCGSCSGKTAEALKKIDGVKEAKGDVKAKTMTVTYDDEKTNVEAFEKAIVELKYKVEK